MSGSVGGVGTTAPDSSLTGRLAQDSAAVKQQLDVALQQEASGKISGVYSGLGSGARTSLDLRPATQHMQTWQNNIDTATTRLNVTQTVLTQIGSIASNFYAQTNNINNVGGSEVGSIAAAAKSALQQVAQLLNTKVGDAYVFAGQDTANPPLPSTDPAVVGAAVLATPPTSAPFSATIGTAVPTVEVGDGQTVQAGLLANQNTLATSAPPTSGSYVRDLLSGLATLASLTPGAAAPTAAAGVREQLGSAVAALSDEQGALGDLQSGLAARKTALAATQTALTAQVSNAEDVDAAATITTVQSLQTQLQASYQLIAGVKSLSLASYL